MQRVWAVNALLKSLIVSDFVAYNLKVDNKIPTRKIEWELIYLRPLELKTFVHVDYAEVFAQNNLLVTEPFNEGILLRRYLECKPYSVLSVQNNNLFHYFKLPFFYSLVCCRLLLSRFAGP